MKVIDFIGTYDKSDLIMYLARISTDLKYKVLVVDATLRQKMRYIVPSMAITKSYITEYEGFDVAIGFNSLDGIKGYLGKTDEDYLAYDYVFLDIDADWGMKGFDLQNAYKNYFVTNFDMYNIKRGIETIGNIEDKIKMTKVIFSRDVNRADDEYLNYLTSEFDIEWSKDDIRFPYEQGDNTAIMENQRLSRIKFKKLTMQYKESMMQIAEEVLETNPSTIRKVCKLIDKE